MKNQIKTLFVISLLALCLSGCDDANTPLDKSGDSGQSKSSHVHVFSEGWSHDETYHWKTCEDCQEVVDKKEHTFNEWVIDKDPTEYEKGHRYKQCDICNYRIEEEVEKLPHTHKAGNPVEENRIEAGCLTEGSYDTVIYCRECGEEMSREHHTITATGHIHTDTRIENRVEPNCTEEGGYDIVTYCTDDDVIIETEHVTLSALNHDLVHHDAKAATCTEAGWAAYDTCSRCDYTTFVEIPATGHQHTATREENRIEPTCTTTGSYDLVTYCTDDNAVISVENKTINALGHNLVHHAGQPATCTEVGWSEYDTCSRCNYTTYVEIPATGHIHTATREENRVPATCTTAGSYDLVTYCTDDNAVLNVEKKTEPALGHKLVYHVGQAATCTEPGYEAYNTCERCDYTTFVEIPATGHQHITTREENRINPTCTTAGSYELVTYCSDDNYVISRETKTLEALGHDLVHHDAKAATCTASGWAAYDTCSRCSYSTYTMIPPTGHIHTATREENRNEPTCTAYGSYDLVTYCTDDNEVISIQTNIWIEPLGHDLVHHDAKAATCTEAGWAAYDTCSRCDYTTFVEIPATGHQHTATREENRIEPTCTTTGSYDLVTYCTDDNVVLSTEHGELPLVDHTYPEWIVDSEATESTDGASHAICSVCGHREDKVLYATGSLDKLKFTLSSGTYKVQSLNTNIEGDVYIPKYYEGKPVTEIRDSAFNYCQKITSIHIPEGITKIGNDAFKGTTLVEEIVLPNSVTSLGTGVFSSSGVVSVTLGNQITAIPNYTFKHAQKLETVVMPNTILSIGQSAFDYCLALQSITLPNSVKEIQYSAFSSCSKLESITLSENLETIRKSAFASCGKLTSITIPSKVQTIEQGVFSYCSSLTEVVVDNQNQHFTSTDGVLFTKDMSTLIYYPIGKTSASYVVPTGVTQIADTAFYMCKQLTSVTLPSGLLSVGKYAFYNCSNIATLEIPSSVTFIDDFAFNYCSAMTSDVNLPNVTSIGENAFYGDKKITSLTLGENLETIAAKAFANCSSLTEISVPASVTSIGEGAFYGCSNLTEISVANGSTNYKSVEGVLFTFDGKTLVQYPAKKDGTSYIIPNGVETISTGAFSGTSNLQSITIPNGVKTIGSFAFEGTYIQSIVLPETVTTIEQQAFARGYRLSSITLPASLTSVGFYAFDTCLELTTVNYTGTIEQWGLINGISSGTFTQCVHLTTIVCSDGEIDRP